jgi:hypothetical protein
MKNRSKGALIIIIVFALIAFFTNPSVEKHREVVKTKLNTLMQQSLYETNDGNNSNELTKSFGAALGSMLGSAILDPFIDRAITSDNYIFFSTTKLTWGGQTKEIGFGAFGNVFLSKDIDNSLKEQLKNVMNSNK